MGTSAAEVRRLQQQLLTELSAAASSSQGLGVGGSPGSSGLSEIDHLLVRHATERAANRASSAGEQFPSVTAVLSDLSQLVEAVERRAEAIRRQSSETATGDAMSSVLSSLTSLVGRADDRALQLRQAAVRSHSSGESLQTGKEARRQPLAPQPPLRPDEADGQHGIISSGNTEPQMASVPEVREDGSVGLLQAIDSEDASTKASSSITGLTSFLDDPLGSEAVGQFSSERRTPSGHDPTAAAPPSSDGAHHGQQPSSAGSSPASSAVTGLTSLLDERTALESEAVSSAKAPFHGGSKLPHESHGVSLDSTRDSDFASPIPPAAATETPDAGIEGLLGYPPEAESAEAVTAADPLLQSAASPGSSGAAREAPDDSPSQAAAQAAVPAASDKTGSAADQPV